MYCPKCGTESPSGQRFCRSCGANLKVISKAVTLSEAIARSDRGSLLPKLKEMMESVKIKHATEEVSHAFDQMNHEISQGLTGRQHHHPWWMHFKDPRTPEQRREDHIVKGTVSLFSGIALMIFLYYLSAALVLKIPPEVLAHLPFEIGPLVKIIWLVGLIPVFTGAGRIMAGLTIKGSQPKSLEGAENSQPPLEDVRQSQPSIAHRSVPEEMPGSVVENTTEMLDRKIPAHGRQ